MSISRPLSWAVVVLAVSVLAAGCGSAATPSSQPAKTLTIAGVPGVARNPFYHSVRLGAEAAAKKYHVKLIWEGADQWSVSAETQIIQTLVTRRVDGMFVTPTDPAAMIPVVQNVVNHHIPVVTVDTTLNNNSMLLSQITTSNVQGGKEAADILAKLMGGSGDVGVIALPPEVTTGQLRVKGFQEEIAAKYPNIHVVSIQNEQHSTTIAANETNHILIRYPKLKGMYAVNDTAAAGIVAALQQMHNTSVKVVAYDAMPIEVQYLKKNQVQALIVQKAYDEGYLAVKYLYEKLTGHGSQVPHTVMLNNIVATPSTMSQAQQWFYGQ